MLAAQALENSVIHLATVVVLEYKHLIQDPMFREDWLHSADNDFGCLAQGVGTCMPTGFNTIFFIKKNAVSPERKVTYVTFVCDLWPRKLSNTKHTCVLEMI